MVGVGGGGEVDRGTVNSAEPLVFPMFVQHCSGLEEYGLYCLQAIELATFGPEGT